MDNYSLHINLISHQQTFQLKKGSKLSVKKYDWVAFSASIDISKVLLTMAEMTSAWLLLLMLMG
jgi:hypothetical protein